jgi:hypothetical protein
MKIRIALALVVLTAANFGALAAETPEEQQACTDDAFKHCGDAIPDRTRVAVCLHQNISKISPACRVVMLRYAPANAAAAAVPLNANARAIR